eukprot:SM000011S18963  [mRNA]  locus=s11:167333:169836:+ [translate_table: standard]
MVPTTAAGALAGFEAGGKDLLVVGAGVLGSLVAQLWLQSHPESRVVGQTRTMSRHDELRALGVLPVVEEGLAARPIAFPSAIFCAPPSGSDDYPAEVRAAIGRWSGAGSLLFTSSSGLYTAANNGPCPEDAPVATLGMTPRLDRLLLAEEEVLKVGGNVVRFAGLYISAAQSSQEYTLERGPHTFWLKKGSVDSRPDHLLNLIHYEDAASLCVAILSSDARGKVFMGCDNTPLSRQELMDATTGSGLFEGLFTGFTATNGPLGKRMCNHETRAALGWKPKYGSFFEFLDEAKRRAGAV